jgi:hypothetical protein
MILDTPQGVFIEFTQNLQLHHYAMANEGYAKIATLMSHHDELAIFRRFSRLNLQTLLYLQAELTHLEADLKQLSIRDQADQNRAVYSKYWWYLAQSEDDHDDKQQWNKVLQIREKLKEYSTKIPVQ